MVGVVEPHGNDLRRLDRNKRPESLFRNGRLLEGWRAENVTLELVQSTVLDFGVEDIVPFLKKPDCCHVARVIPSKSGQRKKKAGFGLF